MLPLKTRLAFLLLAAGHRSRFFGSFKDASGEGLENGHTPHEFATGEDMFRYFPDLVLTGKRVLDIGSGYGGKAAYYMKGHPDSVIGIEPYIEPILSGVRAIRGLCDGGLPVFAAGRGEELPFEDNSFDRVLSYHVFEHVQNLKAVLSECHRVLRPGGRLYAIFPPYYGPQAHHLDFVTTLPALHYFFSAKTLIEATNAMLREHPEINQNPLECSHGLLPNLNGTTVRRFKELVNKSEFQIVECSPLPVGCGVSSGEKGALRFVARCLSKTLMLGPFKDPFTSCIKCVLEK